MALQLPRDEDGHDQTTVHRFWNTRSIPDCTSIGIDNDPEYCHFALHRLDAETGPLFGHAGIEYRKATDLLALATAAAVADRPSRLRRTRRRS